jgi:UDP-N-acetylmuramoyl-tripeptide--D-alanyl-D-alanine ligase
VLGDMRELGSHSVEEHARVGHLAAELGIDVLVAVGPETAPMADAAGSAGPRIEVTAVLDAPAALDAVRAALGPRDAVLVKGSRAVGLEVVARALLDGEVRGPAGCAPGRGTRS